MRKCEDVTIFKFPHFQFSSTLGTLAHFRHFELLYFRIAQDTTLHEFSFL